MKRLKSKALVVALFVGVLTGFGMEFSGCSQQQEKPPIVDNGGSQTNPNGDKENPNQIPDKNPNDDKENPNKNPNENPDKNPGDKTDDKDPPIVNPPEETPAEKLARGVEKFENFVERTTSGKNFTYSQKGYEKDVLAEIDGDEVKLTEGKDVTYFEKTTASQNFSYVWNSEIGLWEKDFSETNADTLISSFTDSMKEVSWGVYDEKNQKLGGINIVNVNGIDLDAVVQVDMSSEDKLQATIKVADNEVKLEIDKIGSTEVTLPTKEQVRDKTVPSENVYEIVDGQYQWNIKLLADIFDKWMKGDNQYKTDYYGRTSNLHTKQILYVKPDLENFVVGVVGEDPQTKENGFAEFKFTSNNFYSELGSGTLKTKEDFVNYLNTIKPIHFGPTSSSIKMEYSTDTATAEQKKEFEAMTKNVFDRLETIGLQGDSINNQGQKTSKFANAKVLFGFKTPNSHTVAGADLGNRQDWNQYYLIELNGKIELLNFSIISSVDGVGTAVDKVINNNSARWMVSTLEERELDAGNKNLFNTYWYENTKDKEK